MNLIPKNLEHFKARRLFEIPTNTEGKSYWHDRKTKEIFGTEGEHTGYYCHQVKQVLPGFIQDINPIGFPTDDTATFVSETFAQELGKAIPESAISLEDWAERLTNVAPIVDENGDPAKYYHVVCRFNGRQVDHAIAMLLYKLLGNRTVKQAFLTEVAATVAELTKDSE